MWRTPTPSTCPYFYHGQTATMSNLEDGQKPGAPNLSASRALLPATATYPYKSFVGVITNTLRMQPVGIRM